MRFPPFGEEVRMLHLAVQVGNNRSFNERDRIPLCETIENSVGLSQARWGLRGLVDIESVPVTAGLTCDCWHRKHIIFKHACVLGAEASQQHFQPMLIPESDVAADNGEPLYTEIFQ